MKITPADVAHVARLANLDVPEDEIPILAGQLSRILDYVEKLRELDTADVAPTTQVARGPAHPARNDEVSPRDGSGEAGRTVRLFRVPRVISER
jgi:aspartyl-tRNA(Asn)/glutamyl-tRNA(Gln) amidotransferase subunit C